MDILSVVDSAKKQQKTSKNGCLAMKRLNELADDHELIGNVSQSEIGLGRGVGS